MASGIIKTSKFNKYRICVKEINNLPNNTITRLLSLNNTIFADTDEGLVYLNDFGETWKTVEKLDNGIMDIHIDSTKLYVAADGCHVLDIIQN